MLDGHVYVPTSLWVPAIVGSDGSVLPTPTAQLAKHGVTPDVHRNSKMGSNLWDIPHLLPTPVVNDMGAGKTVEKWDAWTAEQREKHRNGNGHGKSLSIEVQRLLPTPQAWDHKSFGPNVDWEKRAEKHADSVASVLMNLPSDDGSSGLDG